MGPLTASDLKRYKPRKDHSHLRLGLRKEGMLLFLEHIGFARWTGPGEKQFDDVTHWNYNPSYARNPDLAQWLDSEVGAVKEGTFVHPELGEYPSGGLLNVTGYDLAEFIRLWQREAGLEELSVCEIILVQPELQHLRQHVGIANIFWSHIQMESFLGCYSTYHDQNSKYEQSTFRQLNYVRTKFGQDLPTEDSSFIWLDYFCLKQCQSDFDVDCIISLIKDIGTLVAALDAKFEYVKRSFCILELYGAVRGESTLFCLHSFPKDFLRHVLASDRTEVDERDREYWVGPINVAAAQTRRPEHKHMIDVFIQNLPGGFDFVNGIITNKLTNR